MIRIPMLGRTGNNLFQYAAGRALSEKYGVPLVMDASWFNAAGWASVSQLRQLPIKAALVRDPTPASRTLRKIFRKHRWELMGLPVYREKEDDCSFDPAFLDHPADSVLIGYFQSPKYFAAIETALRDEIRFTGRELDGESAKWAGKITASRSVAIHVRRTDYVGNPNTDICGEGYYAAAIARIRAAVQDAEFFVFSDDPGWCRRRYCQAGFHVLDCVASRTDPLNDLHLMSLAHHHIIANSSYSWWGAWIGKKEGQMVMAPDPWLAGIYSPAEDRFCEGWEAIPSAARNDPS
jgi:hypothetical protein